MPCMCWAPASAIYIHSLSLMLTTLISVCAVIICYHITPVMEGTDVATYVHVGLLAKSHLASLEPMRETVGERGYPP